MRSAAVYLGGLLGPFASGVVASMLPELASTFGVSQGTAASSVTAYLLPFALVMLVSGTLGEGWGPMRTIRLAYVGFVVASVLAALAPWFWLFQTGRALQGVSNAFTTPLLLTKLAAITPRERLGRALGLYGAVQSIGQTTAPLVGGLAAESSWRWAFAGSAVLAGVLTASPLPADEQPSGRGARWRAAWQPVVLWSGIVIFVAWACLAGLPFLVAFRAEDAFGLGPGARGVVLTAFGIAGFVTARLVGAAADRFGPRAAVCAGLLLGAVAVGAIGVGGSLWVLVLAWAVGGVCCQLILVGVNALVLSRDDASRGGAISVVTALRFLGMSASPGAFTAVYRADPAMGFLVPGTLLVAVTPLLAHKIFRNGTGPRARLRHSRG